MYYVLGISLQLFLAGLNAQPTAYVTSGDLLNDSGDAISRLYFVDLTSGNIQQLADLFIQAGFDELFDMQTGLDTTSGTFFKSDGYSSVHRFNTETKSLRSPLNFPFANIESTTYDSTLKSLIVTGNNADGTFVLAFPSDNSGTQQLAFINTTVLQYFRGVTTNQGKNFYYITGNNVTDYFPLGATTYLNMIDLSNQDSVVTTVPLSCQGYPLLPMYLYWSETHQLLYGISPVYPSGSPTKLSYYLHTLSFDSTNNCKLTQLKFAATKYAQVNSWAIDENNNKIYAGVVDPDNLLCSFDMTTGQGSSTCLGLDFFISSITLVPDTK